MRNPALRRQVPAEFWLSLERHGAAALQLEDHSLLVLKSKIWAIDSPIYQIGEYGLQGIYVMPHRKPTTHDWHEDPYAYPSTKLFSWHEYFEFWYGKMPVVEPSPYWHGMTPVCYIPMVSRRPWDER